MGEFSSLLVDVGVDEMSDFMCGLLRLSGGSTSQDDDMVMNEVDFIGDSIDSVGSSSGSPLIMIGILESAQAITPPAYLTAMMVVPIVYLG